jgi:hypothetical protein
VVLESGPVKFQGAEDTIRSERPHNHRRLLEGLPQGLKPLPELDDMHTRMAHLGRVEMRVGQ